MDEYPGTIPSRKEPEPRPDDCLSGFLGRFYSEEPVDAFACLTEAFNDITICLLLSEGSLASVPPGYYFDASSRGRCIDFDIRWPERTSGKHVGSWGGDLIEVYSDGSGFVAESDGSRFDFDYTFWVFIFPERRPDHLLCMHLFFQFFRIQVYFLDENGISLVTIPEGTSVPVTIAPMGSLPGTTVRRTLGRTYVDTHPKSTEPWYGGQQLEFEGNRPKPGGKVSAIDNPGRCVGRNGKQNDPKAEAIVTQDEISAIIANKLNKKDKDLDNLKDVRYYQVETNFTSFIWCSAHGIIWSLDWYVTQTYQVEPVLDKDGHVTGVKVKDLEKGQKGVRESHIYSWNAQSGGRPLNKDEVQAVKDSQSWTNAFRLLRLIR